MLKAHRARSRILAPSDGQRRAWPVAPRFVGRLVAGAALPWSTNGFWTAWMVTAVASTFAAALAGGVGLAVVTIGAVGATPALVLSSLQGRAAVLVDRALPDALEVAGRALRSGSSLRGAIAEAAAEVPEPLRRGWDAIVTEAARGSALAAAVDRWAVAAPGEGARLAAAALALGAELGGAAAAALDGVAATLRDRNAVRREIRALSSQARASALVIVVAPVGFTMIMALADPATLRFLVATPIGLACLTGGLVLDGLGAWWMHRITIGAAR